MNSPANSHFGLAPRTMVDDKYRLDSLVGAGGGGEVWEAAEAVDATAWRTVALKLVKVPASLSEKNNVDWLHEVRAVSQVTCDALPRVYTVGTTNIPGHSSIPFIAMELLRGETLESRISRGNIHWRKALAIALRVASALDTCHAADVIHCDLKPRNIFLEKIDKRRVLVLDFGIASAGGVLVKAPIATSKRRSVEETDVQTVDTSARPEAPTSSFIMGTPGYISPERLAGLSPEHHDDAFALGVVLYRMITSRLPQRIPPSVLGKSKDPTGADSYEIALRKSTVERDFDPITKVAPTIPRAVAALIDMLLGPAQNRPARGDLERCLTEVYHRPYGRPARPYAGLGAFDQQRMGYLPGRSSDIESIARRLDHQICVVLCGSSGTGKSSLALAGVTARIDENMLLEKEGWESLVLRPSSDRERLAIASNETTATTANDPTMGLVVVADQFEEVLSLPVDERRSFCKAFTALVERTTAVVVAGRRIEPHDSIRVVATVRDDLFGRVAALPELERLLERNLYMVRGVDPNAAREIVIDPLEDMGFALEQTDEVDVVADVARELERDPSSLPLVQFALARLWDCRDSKTHSLPAKSWKEIGGIVGALGDAAQDLYDGFSADERSAARQLFLALFDVDGTRNVVREASLDPSAVSLVPRWMKEGILRRRVDADGHALVEPLHEALAKGWPQLGKWLEEVRADRELLRDAQRDAKRWERHGKPADMLWGGTLLQQDRVLKGIQDEPGRAFVEASFAAARAARDAAEQEKRRAFWIGRVLPVSMVAVLLVVSLGGWWVTRDAKSRVDVALADAKVSEAKAKRSAEDALREKAGAEHERENAKAAEAKASAAEKAAAGLRDQYLADLNKLREDVKKARTRKEFEELQRRIEGQSNENKPTTNAPNFRSPAPQSSFLPSVPDPFD